MNRVLTCIAATLFLFSTSYSQSANKAMTKALKKAIGKDLKGFTFFSYPTDNFGLVTSYQQTPKPANFICDMWRCTGINKPEGFASDWLKMNGFASIGSGGSIAMTKSTQTKVALDVILPKIYEVVGVDFSGSQSNTKNVTLSFGKAHMRMLDRQTFSDHINSLDNAQILKQAWNGRQLVVAVADCVVEKLAVTVTLDASTAAKIDAKLGSDLTSKIFQSTELNVKVDRTSSTTYNFSVDHPVIFARLMKKQPASGGLSGGAKEFTDWATVNDADPTKN